MPDARTDGNGIELEDCESLHARVVTDADLDHRYHKPLSNVTKVEAICHATGLKAEEFDLTAPFPLDVWADSDDTGLIACGGFVADLQEQFYALMIDRTPQTASHLLWEAHALAEYWNARFDMLLMRRNGVIMRDKRNLH
jgi:hypothetical protein